MRRRQSTIPLRFFIDTVDPLFQVQLGIHEATPMEASVTGFSGLFGADLAAVAGPEETPLRFRRAEGMRIIRDNNNHRGCLAPGGQEYDDAVLLVHRGECTFLEKLFQARASGASGVVVISDEDQGLNPSAAATDIAATGKLDDVAIVVLTRTTGMMVSDMMDVAETYGMGQLMVTVDPERRPATDSDIRHIPEEAQNAEAHRVLYLNGHPLLNTRLMV
jgi:ER degradation enhancer, mannosidase alpha-like 1